jgi:hypothetical protein
LIVAAVVVIVLVVILVVYGVCVRRGEQCSNLKVVVVRDEPADQALAVVLLLGNECIPEDVGMPRIRQTIGIPRPRSRMQPCMLSLPVMDVPAPQTNSSLVAVS